MVGIIENIAKNSKIAPESDLGPPGAPYKCVIYH